MTGSWAFVNRDLESLDSGFKSCSIRSAEFFFFFCFIVVFCESSTACSRSFQSSALVQSYHKTAILNSIAWELIITSSDRKQKVLTATNFWHKYFLFFYCLGQYSILTNRPTPVKVMKSDQAPRNVLVLSWLDRWHVHTTRFSTHTHLNCARAARASRVFTCAYI